MCFNVLYVEEEAADGVATGTGFVLVEAFVGSLAVGSFFAGTKCATDEV